MRHSVEYDEALWSFDRKLLEDFLSHRHRHRFVLARGKHQTSGANARRVQRGVELFGIVGWSDGDQTSPGKIRLADHFRRGGFRASKNQPTDIFRGGNIEGKSPAQTMPQKVN